MNSTLSRIPGISSGSADPTGNSSAPVCNLPSFYYADAILHAATKTHNKETVITIMYCVLQARCFIWHTSWCHYSAQRHAFSANPAVKALVS